VESRSLPIIGQIFKIMVPGIQKDEKAIDIVGTSGIVLDRHLECIGKILVMAS
jgi:hypothetical protein